MKSFFEITILKIAIIVVLLFLFCSFIVEKGSQFMECFNPPCPSGEVLWSKNTPFSFLTGLEIIPASRNNSNDNYYNFTDFSGPEIDYFTLLNGILLSYLITSASFFIVKRTLKLLKN